MNAAQQSVATITEWIASNSVPYRTPLGGETSVGRWAVIVPSDLAAPPMAGFDPAALPVFVPAAQVVRAPSIVLTAPDSQGSAYDRLWQLAWKISGAQLAPAIVLPVLDPTAILQATLDRYLPGGIDMDATALLFVKLWAFNPADRVNLMRKLPVL